MKDRDDCECETLAKTRAEAKLPDKPMFCSREKCLKLTWSKEFKRDEKSACPSCGCPAKLVPSPHGANVWIHKEKREV